LSAGAKSPPSGATARVINLGVLPGSIFSEANSINDAGQAVGIDLVSPGGAFAVEWSNGQVINLGGLPGSTDNAAASINDAGQVVGTSFVGGVTVATEWSNGQAIDLGPGVAFRINDTGQAAGYISAPESSTWAMMLLGFVGLGFAGYRSAGGRCSSQTISDQKAVH
jgi:probable HAF family extracellular repeat protein